MTAPNISTGEPPPGVAVIGTGYWGRNLACAVCGSRFQEDGAKGLREIKE